MKFLAILPATLIAAAPAMAGPYVNVEANSGFTGSDYTGTSRSKKNSTVSPKAYANMKAGFPNSKKNKLKIK